MSLKFQKFKNVDTIDSEVNPEDREVSNNSQKKNSSMFDVTLETQENQRELTDLANEFRKLETEAQTYNKFLQCSGIALILFGLICSIFGLINVLLPDEKGLVAEGPEKIYRYKFMIEMEIVTNAFVVLKNCYLGKI
ncbi:unnamed protein product [Moneuplotes crassus]|uniref:Uncharacterized protein n=1 Tax=Euplotes crassus TaxID=5936 RepID=A0AAD1Y6C5_EUPCR|nr:unnamed protein product [Moneuplotes crassus]